MTTTTTVQVPAGWCADPVTIAASGAATQRRWWDGAAWSTHTAPFEAPTATITLSTLTVVGSAPATVSPSGSARVAENMPLHTVSTVSNRTRTGVAAEVAAAAPYSALSPATSSAAFSSSSSVGSAETQSDYEPFAHRRRVEMLAAIAPSSTARNPLGLRVHTVSIWLMATMPLTQTLLIFWVFTSLPRESSAWTRALTVALPFVLYAALAGQDTRQLENSGHLRTSHWATALVTPLLGGARRAGVSRDRRGCVAADRLGRRADRGDRRLVEHRPRRRAATAGASGLTPGGHPAR
jgi:hypothetical protein